jgi:hypothetical protein
VGQFKTLLLPFRQTAVLFSPPAYVMQSSDSGLLWPNRTVKEVSYLNFGERHGTVAEFYNL